LGILLEDTDFSSIVFSDEGDVLAGSDNPDLKYNQVIRPWKSRLGLLYVEKHNFILDIRLIILTIMAIISRQQALLGVRKLLEILDADPQLISVARRDQVLEPYPPPGSDKIVVSRDEKSGTNIHTSSSIKISPPASIP